MTWRRWVVVVSLLAACGDDASPKPPETLQAGPVTIDTQSMTLTLGSLVQAQFLSIGTATREVEEFHYYDPRGDSTVTLTPVTHATKQDGEWTVLDGGARMQLTACEVGECAALDIDASRVEKVVQISIALPVTAYEPLYGTGDSPARANVYGTVREMSLRVDTDSDSTLNETHVPVPLVLWPRRNAGMFIADDRPGALDLGFTNPDRVSATFTLPARGALRVYLYTAASPVDLVRQYVALTTKPAVPPRWAFAPQQWRNAHDNSGQLLDDMAQMRTRGIPGSTMWIDNPWQTAYNDFTIDETRFANIDSVIDQLHANGYKVLFWSTPYVSPTGLTAADHAEAEGMDYLVTDDVGNARDWPWQNGPGALVDFTRPGATEWWQERIERVIARGASGFKLDFGEELVPDLGGNIVESLLADGDNSTHHNRYTAGYHGAYLAALPADDKFLITRAGAWGEQNTNPSIWPGDLDSDFTEFRYDRSDGKKGVGGLPSAISRGLGLSVSGYPFYGSDIGGFKDFPTTEVLLRWAQYASLGTIMQLGGGGKSHNPWDTTLFDAGAEAIYKRYATLHMQLNPLLWTLAQSAGTDGTPVTRPAKFVYDCECDDAMFLLGEDILVAPIITAGATTRTVTLPPGNWVEAQTGTIRTGTVTVAAPLAELPMFYRAGSIVPMFARYADTLLPATAGGVTSYADTAYGSELRLVYTPGATASTALHDGTTAMADGASVTVTAGTEYSVFTLDIDARGQTGVFAAPTSVTAGGTALALAASAAAVETCAAPGCWYFDAGTTHLQARVHGSSTLVVQ